LLAITIGEGLADVSGRGWPISKLYKPLFDFTGRFKGDRGCVEDEFQDAEGNEGFREVSRGPSGSDATKTRRNRLWK
jgi:hypothetical protein